MLNNDGPDDPDDPDDPDGPDDPEPLSLSLETTKIPAVSENFEQNRSDYYYDNTIIFRYGDRKQNRHNSRLY